MTVANSSVKCMQMKLKKQAIGQQQQPENETRDSSEVE